MSIAEKSAANMEALAVDDSHGYDQSSRWGPDFDCSSAVIDCCERAGAGVKSAGATYTGNMYAVFLRCGYMDVTAAVNLSTGSGMLRGDVLLNATHHTAMFIGNGRIAQASGNELGGITGGQAGDQTGREINTSGYYNFPWDYVLRYPDGVEAVSAGSSTYTVVSGDSLWAIAQRYGVSLAALIAANNITDPDLIYSGQILTIPGQAPTTPQESVSPAESVCTVTLPILSSGDNSGAVRALQTLLILRGCGCGPDGADGDFGPNTVAAVQKFKAARGLGIGDTVDAKVWAALIG